MLVSVSPPPPPHVSTKGISTVKGKKKADVSSVSPSSERSRELWVVLGFICRKWSYAMGGNIVTRKTGINKLNEKRSLIP